jgi:hypothetical protein
MLGISTLLGFSFLFFEYENITNLTLVYGFMIIVAYISTLIVGQMYKIVPFLVWYHKYSSKVGIEKVPMLKDLFSEKLAELNLYLMCVGIIISVLSFLSEIKLLLLIGFALLFVSSVIFSLNMIKVFRS